MPPEHVLLRRVFSNIAALTAVQEALTHQAADLTSEAERLAVTAFLGEVGGGICWGLTRFTVLTSPGRTGP